MTDRLKGCWVAFERDIREDDAEIMLNAIRMIKGVADVTVKLAMSEDWMNRIQIRHELGNKLMETIDLVFKGGVGR